MTAWISGIGTEKLLILLVAAVGLLLICMVCLMLLLNRRAKRAEEKSRNTEAEMQRQIEASAEQSKSQAKAVKAQMDYIMESMDDSMRTMIGRIEQVQQTQSDTIGGQLRAVRKSLDERIEKISEENREQISELKSSMEEQLGEAVDKRISDSFSQVSGRLEQFSQSLGALESLAGTVDEFNKMLGGTTPLGLYGEAQLGNLLAEMLAPQQYAQHAQVHPDKAYTADYAVVMPGQDSGRTVYLPIDASLPTREYQELRNAMEHGVRAEIDSARELLESSVRMHARRISEQIIAPPYTTDYGILFLQSEGLYAELLRMNGLAERIQRESHIVLAGPATLAALLSGLQVGFRSLAIEQRTDEIIGLLSAVRSDIARYAGSLDRTQKRLHQASQEIDRAQRQGEAIAKRLSDIGELPQGDRRQLSAGKPLFVEDDDEDAWD
ncbi:MAG: DNA recombination protein RmuC [Clostridia bacterium]|nr:DNA recombination protein RmuC [Clostridia bacterium]